MREGLATHVLFPDLEDRGGVRELAPLPCHDTRWEQSDALLSCREFPVFTLVANAGCGPAGCQTLLCLIGNSEQPLGVLLWVACP